MAIGITAKKAIVADATLSGLVGTRVYPLNYPTGVTFPCITYRVISGFSEQIPDETVFRSRVQFDVWADTYNDAAEVKSALVSLFNFADMTVDGQHIIKGRVDLVFDLYEDDTKLHRSVVDVVFNHEGD